MQEVSGSIPLGSTIFQKFRNQGTVKLLGLFSVDRVELPDAFLNDYDPASDPSNAGIRAALNVYDRYDLYLDQFNYSVLASHLGEALWGGAGAVAIRRAVRHERGDGLWRW